MNPKDENQPVYRTEETYLRRKVPLIEAGMRVKMWEVKSHTRGNGAEGWAGAQ